MKNLQQEHKKVLKDQRRSRKQNVCRTHTHSHTHSLQENVTETKELFRKGFNTENQLKFESKNTNIIFIFIIFITSWWTLIHVVDGPNSSHSKRLLTSLQKHFLKLQPIKLGRVLPR